MRVGLIIYHFDPARGGGEGAACSLGERLHDLGHEVHIFAHTIAPQFSWAAYHHVPVPHALRTWRDWLFAHQVRRLLPRSPVDVTLSFGRTLRCDIYMPSGGIHLAWMERELHSIASPRLRALTSLRRRLSIRHRLILSLERQQLRSENAKVFVALSRQIKEDMINLYHLPPEKVIVIPNGVDLDLFNPSRREPARSELRGHLGLDDALVLLFVGHNFRLKGLHSLIRALGTLRNEAHGHRLVALVVGRGNPGPYRRLARSLGCAEDVNFVGSTTEIAAYYHVADLLVYPTFYDTCSLVCLEALASGLPVITTPNSGVGDILTDGMEGYIVQPDDVESVAKAIRAMLDRDRRARAAAAARNLAEHYSIEKQTESMVNVLDIVENRGERM